MNSVVLEGGNLDAQTISIRLEAFEANVSKVDRIRNDDVLGSARVTRELYVQINVVK